MNIRSDTLICYLCLKLCFELSSLLRDLSEISRGRGWKTGGSYFFEPFNREGYEKKRQEKREGHRKLQ